MKTDHPERTDPVRARRSRHRPDRLGGHTRPPAARSYTVGTLMPPPPAVHDPAMIARYGRRTILHLTNQSRWADVILAAVNGAPCPHPPVGEDRGQGPSNQLLLLWIGARLIQPDDTAAA